MAGFPCHKAAYFLLVPIKTNVVCLNDDVYFQAEVVDPDGNVLDRNDIFNYETGVSTDWKNGDLRVIGFLRDSVCYDSWNHTFFVENGRSLRELSDKDCAE